MNPNDKQSRSLNEEEKSIQTYEYIFSTGEEQKYSIQKDSHRSKKPFITVLIVALCVVCSFAAGVGGSFLAGALWSSSADDSDQAQNGGIDQDLYLDDPENVLEKAEDQTSPFGSAGESVFSISQVVQKVQDTVVILDVTYFDTEVNSNISRSGSGVIVSSDGYIVTCHHVVEDASLIEVTLNSEKKYVASLVGSDAASDIAVIHITPEENESFEYARQGCSKNLVVGERVVAIGNPLGTLGGTVTDGIVSATERKIWTKDGESMTLLQTNAAINSGNSGGGLFNLDGQLIGIVNAKYAAEGIEGLAFAVPIDTAYTIELELIEYGYVRGNPDHGLELRDITVYNYWDYVYYGIDTLGCYVLSSEFQSELQYLDRIVSINGTLISTSDQIKKMLKQAKIGDEWEMVYVREGKEYSTTLILEELVPDYLKNAD